MIRRNKKTRKYQSPQAVETSLMLERNFCESLVRFDTGFESYQVDELENVSDETEIFEF